MYDEKTEHERNIKIIKNSIAMGRFINKKKCYCPVCDKKCEAWYNIMKNEKIVVCENCYSDYIIRIRRHEL